MKQSTRELGGLGETEIVIERTKWTEMRHRVPDSVDMQVLAGGC
jgi:hypothetical protein